MHSFENNIKKSKNIFEIMSCSYLCMCKNYREHFIRFFSRYSPKDYCSVTDAIKNYFDNNAKDPEYYLNILKNTLLDLHSKHNASDIENDIFYYSIIESIDSIVDYDAFSKFSFTDEFFMKTIFHEVKQLSGSFSEFIGLYPKLKNKFNDTLYESSSEKKVGKLNQNITKLQKPLRSQYPSSFNSINAKLKNYFFIDQAQIGVDLVQYKNDKNFNMRKNIEKNSILRFALFPTINHNLSDLLDISFDDEKLLFSINGYHNDCIENELIKRFEKCFESILNQNVDVVVFPEMLLSERILEQIQKKIKKTRSISLPQIIVLGTIWKNNSNQCVILDNRGTIIFKQHKQTPFVYDNIYTENLENQDNKINFFDIDGFGRIFTFICKDIMEPEMRNICRKMEGDYVILPAFTNSLDLVDPTKEMASEFWCTTIMCNSCSAFCNKDNKTTDCQTNKQIGFITVPSKNKNKRDSRIEEYFFTDTCNSDHSHCRGFMCDISYNDFVSTQEITSQNVSIYNIK